MTDNKAQVLRIPGPTAVPSAKPFENDLLEREPFVSELVELVRTLKLGGRVAIEGPWGSGKTTILDMLHECLASADITSIKINAWETSHAPDPLVAVICELAEVLEGLPTCPPKLVDAPESLRTNVADVARLMAPQLLANIASAFTQGIIDKEVIGTIKGNHDSTTELQPTAVDDYRQMRKALSEIKTTLAEVTAGLDGPLVLLVDELDRCQPDYALRFLERSAHVLSVEEMIVVFAVDRRQLDNMVRVQYGADTDATAYLQRFIDISLEVPTSRTRGRQFVGDLLEAAGLGASILDVWDRGDRFAQFLLPVIPSSLDLSLRQQQRLLTRLEWILRQTRLDSKSSSFVVCLYFLMAIDCRGYSLHLEILAGKIQADQFFDRLQKMDPGLSVFESLQGQAMFSILFAAFMPSQFNTALELLSSRVDGRYDVDQSHCESVFRSAPIKRRSTNLRTFERYLAMEPGI